MPTGYQLWRRVWTEPRQGTPVKLPVHLGSPELSISHAWTSLRDPVQRTILDLPKLAYTGSYLIYEQTAFLGI
jgi:hypothetical protein